MLRPAVDQLRAAGDEVVIVSRGPRADDAVAADATDATALSAALAEHRWDDAIVYAPAVSTSSLAFVRAATPGRCVLVRVTADADPALGILVVPRDTVQLGWRADASADGPWHSPAQISSAALSALADGEPRTLGAVRPWSDRP